MTSIEFNGLSRDRLSTLAAGASLSLLVFAVLTGQVGLYFWRRSIYSRDPLWIKGFVVCIWALQALEIALVYRMTTSVHGENYLAGAGPLGEISFESATYLGASVITAFIVHALFVRRIYVLNKILATIKIPIVLGLVVALEGSFGIFSMVSMIKMGIKGRPSTLCWAILVWLGLSITADVLIAWSLCYILNKSRTGFARTDWMIKRLTVFFVQTGLIMSFVAVVTVAIWTVAKLDTDHLMMSFPMGGIYATCLMANLIARESYFHPRVAYEDTELPTILRGSMVVAAPRNFDKISPELLHERSSQTHTSITFSNDGSATAVEL